MLRNEVFDGETIRRFSSMRTVPRLGDVQTQFQFMKDSKLKNQLEALLAKAAQQGGTDITDAD